jgi:hypothetical protein
VIEARVGKLVSRFSDYVRVYDDRVPFTGEQLAAHRQSVELRRRADGVRAALEDKEFQASLRRTLLAWGIGRRASRLVASDDFAAALRAVAPSLEALEPLMIDGGDLPGDVAGQLLGIIDSLGVVTNKAKLVAGTKTLHHLLPDLIPPMDRAWTGAFFQFHLPEWQDTAGQRRIFGIAYNHFAAVAGHVHPSQYVTGPGWRTSSTKILDNALIGFCKAELGTSPLVVDETVESDAPNQVVLEVPGYPPAKNEALSMLGAGHSHAPRVRLLLRRHGKRAPCRDLRRSPEAGSALTSSSMPQRARIPLTPRTTSAASPTSWRTRPTWHPRAPGRPRRRLALRQRPPDQGSHLPGNRGRRSQLHGHDTRARLTGPLSLFRAPSRTGGGTVT